MTRARMSSMVAGLTVALYHVPGFRSNRLLAGNLMRSFLKRTNAATRAAYRARPRLLEEHHGIEQTVLAGGYGYRQIVELVQNGADAILEAHENGTPPAAGNRIR